MVYKNVFDARDLFLSEIIVPLILFFSFICISIYLLEYLRIRNCRTLIITALLNLFMLIFIGSKFYRFCELRAIFYEGSYETISGEVSDLTRTVAGRFHESFKVNDMIFNYGEYFPPDGFRIFAKGHDFITNGRSVRVKYLNTKILSMDVKVCERELSFSALGSLDCIKIDS